MKKILFSFSALFIYCNLTAQIKFEHYSIENGLSQSVVLDVVQDKTGFLWIATQDGLNRFDGYEFKIFKNDPNDSTSISDNWINAISLGKENCLWLATESGGINKFDLSTYKSVRYLAGKGDSSKFQSNIARDILEDKIGQVWVATWGGGLSVLKKSDSHFTTFRNNKLDSTSLSDDFVRVISEDKDGSIWVGTKNGLNQLKTGMTKFRRIYSNTKNNNTLSENFITAILKDSKNKLWIGTREGLNLSEDDGKVFKRLLPDEKNKMALNDKIILTVFEDSNQNIWAGTYSGGLSKIISEKGIGQNYKQESNNLNSLSGNYIRSIFQDRTGLFWIGTWGNGLNKLNMNPYKFKHISVSENGLSHKFVRTFFEDKVGNFWIGTFGSGINIINKSSGAFSYLINDPKKKNSISNNDIYATQSDKNGMIWIGTNSGLNRYEPETGKISNFANNPKEIPKETDDVIRSVVNDKKGNLWIGKRAGVLFYDAERRSFTTFVSDSLPTNANVSQLFISSQNELWISVRDDGVYRYNISNKPEFISHYKTNLADTNSISHNNVLYIFEDSGNSIWFGSASGLNELNPANGTVRKFYKKDGLPSEVIYGIAESENGILWISTNSGISKYDPNKKNIWGKHFRNYDLNDGLQSNEFNTGSVFKNLSGEIFFGGINGYNQFYPNEINDNPFVPPIVFASTKILDKEVYPDFRDGNRKLIYHYDDKVFSFEMSSLDFTKSEKNQYAYKLIGFDDEWNFSGGRRFATYTNLNPGTYTLQIIGSNNDGVWNEIGSSLLIEIIPPFWMTWWFRIFIVLLIVVIPVLIYINRIQKLLELERLRVRIASDLHDDVGGSLTKISLHADLINAGVDPEKINSNLEIISNLSREVIRTMSDIVWAIDSRNDTIGNMIDRMRDFASGILTEKNIRLKFEVSGLESDQKINVDTRQNLYLVLKETVNNSVKYSEASEVKILLNQKDEKFQMIISDNGKGISGQKNKTGHGLKNIQMRAERIGANVEIKSQAGFEIKLERQKI